MNTGVALKAIIKKDDKILAIKRSSTETVFQNLWDIPGGRMNFGEKPTEALKREIREETSLEVEIKEPIAVWSFMASSELQVVGITFVAEYISGDIILSDEHVDFEWINPTDFLKLDAIESLKKEVEKYSKFVTKNG